MANNYIDAYISKEKKHDGDNTVGIWVRFPTTKEYLKKVFQNIDIDGSNYGEWKIEKYNSNIQGLASVIPNTHNINELNYFTSIVLNMEVKYQKKFISACKLLDYEPDIKDLINLTYNLECYTLYPKLKTAKDYGKFIFEKMEHTELKEDMIPYVNFEDYANSLLVNNNGKFTDNGFIVREKGMEVDHYDGETIPSEYQVTPKRAELCPVATIELKSQSPDDKLKEITEYLENGIKELFDSDKYKNYLKVMSKFHNYSFNNSILIAMQKPDASYVAGFTSWEKNFERTPIKGQKGIKIIAPSPIKVQKKVLKIDPNTNEPMKDKNGDTIYETRDVEIPKYKVVHVFDVSQTEGKELPSIGVDSLKGDVKNYKDFFNAIVNASPVPIVFGKTESGVKGFYNTQDKQITLGENMSEMQTLKTLIHEVAHAKLHDKDISKDERETQPDRRTKEVEAESVAFTVCRHYDIDTSDYSFGYIAGWSKNRELSELKGSLDTIRKTSADIINTVDEQLKSIQKERDKEKKPSVRRELKLAKEHVFFTPTKKRFRLKADSEVEL